MNSINIVISKNTGYFFPKKLKWTIGCPCPVIHFLATNSDSLGSLDMPFSCVLFWSQKRWKSIRNEINKKRKWKKKVPQGTHDYYKWQKIIVICLFIYLFIYFIHSLTYWLAWQSNIQFSLYFYILLYFLLYFCLCLAIFFCFYIVLYWLFYYCCYF